MRAKNEDFKCRLGFQRMRKLNTATDAENNAEKKDMSEEPLKASDIIEINSWRNKKIIIVKPLIPLRIAQILWAGGSQILIIFYAVILKQRGLTILELSSIFSVSFLFQIAVASVAGIVTDRIGYAKHILLFLILGTLFIIICILFAPELRKRSCIVQEIDLTCYNSSEKFCDICNENRTECLSITNFTENIIKDCDKDDIFKYLKSLINKSETSLNNYSIYNANVLDTLSFKNCSMICEDFETEKVLFVFYCILILGLFSFWSTGNRFFDFVALNLAIRYGSNFGKEAFIATFGELFIVAAAAFALNIETSDDEKKINYDLAFSCCAVALALTFISVYCVKNVKVLPGKQLKKKAWKIISNIDALVFIVIVFIAGNGYSYNATFHLWFLESLKASKIVIGLHSLTSSFYGILVFSTSNWWIACFGTNKIFVLGLLSYAVNEIGYSFLYNPWLSLLFEVTTVFSCHLMWVALVIHCNEIAPEGLAATLNAVAGTVHYGVGRSTAIFGGGLMMNYFGARIAYRVFGCIFLVTAVFYSIFLYIRQLKFKRKFRNDGDVVEELKHMKTSDEQEA